jgi:nitroreductase
VRSYDEKVAETPQISKWKCWHAPAILRPERMNPIKGEQLLMQLNWRYAVKHFDPTRKISPEDWAKLEHALILSPSSYGLQPWTFIVITDRKMRERLFPATWKQGQILDCSHYVVFAAKTKMSEEHIDRHIARTVEVRGGTVEAMQQYREVMVGDVVSGRRNQANGRRDRLSRARNFYDERGLDGNRHLSDGRISTERVR